MDTGEFLTRITIWITFSAYTVGSVVFALSKGRPRWDEVVRIVFTVGCLALIAHYVCAFHFYHGWSHQAAYAETARQTAEVFHVNWGGGLFINYGLLLAWIIDLGWWWRSGIDSYRRRPWIVIAAWHGFLLFIIFNATVVFKDGLIRWIGLGICVILFISWWKVVRQGLITRT